jgi:hypothetical protein
MADRDRMRIHEGVRVLDGVRQDPDHCQVGGAHAPLQAVVFEHGACVVPECEQHVVVEFFEAPGAVCADHDSLEAVIHVHGNRHERIDFFVGRGYPIAWRVFAHDLVPLEDPLGEPLRHRAVGGVVAEPAVAHKVEPAVAVGVALRQKQPTFGLGEAHGNLEHQLVQVTGSSAGAVRAEHLLAQLARPLPLGLTGSLDPQPKPLLMPQRLALFLQLPLEELAAVAAHACRLLQRAGALVRPAAPLLVERRSRGSRAPFVGPARERRHHRNREQDGHQVVQGVGEVAASQCDAECEHACRAEQRGSHADQRPSLPWAQCLNWVRVPQDRVENLR